MKISLKQYEAKSLYENTMRTFFLDVFKTFLFFLAAKFKKFVKENIVNEF